MSAVQNPTYLLAPNWTFRPGGSIALGNIIVDPFRPHRPLTKADPAKPLETETATEKNWRLSLETARNVNLSIWTVFLEKVHLKVGANRESIKNGHFTMKSLDTEFLKDDPSDEEIVALCNHPDVRNFMRLDSLLCKPVYMVTGLKIAKGFALKGEDISKSSFAAEGMAEVAPDVSLGARAEASTKTTISDQFEAENDIIFAYQLLKITPKGWSKNKKIELIEFQPRQAFLSDEEKEQRDPKVDGEKDVLTVEDLKELGRFVETIEVKSDELEGVYVVYEGLTL